ncbi:YibE/F family protein [candidate division KSB3 bacterium]|uniref:YibE/F family protein n=1 Tax=candidate division KSB3 bacterium TaxID=2044937 RepID=A0A9D5JXL0_9BACT|nr:YibE/F family protein [candidate division KSB3 bacterium]MBD3325702.1 YibE/F family protein [candidate division KSB3 bacterium]
MRASHNMKRDAVLVSVFLLITIGLYFVPTGFENRMPKNSVRCTGKVIAVDNSEVLQQGIVKVGMQGLTLKLLDGPYKGQEVDALNQLIGKMELDKIFTEGDVALVVLSLKNGEIYFANAQDHYRLGTELILLLCFAGLLLLFAGVTGAKALLSFLFAGLMLWKVMIPFFLKGIDPILVSLGVVIALTSAIIFLVGGLTTRGLVAFVGSLLGIGVTIIMALLFSKGFHLHGAIKPFSETLLYSGFPHLNLTRIFLAGIFIAASGAVMDLAMDVASGMDELVTRKPDITFLDALQAGFGIGRPVVGTMTTTLLLAYSGGYTALLMAFMAQGVPVVNLLNLNYVAAEILHTLVGSFGLVTVAPFTAGVGAFVYTWKRVSQPIEQETPVKAAPGFDLSE